MKKNIFKSCLIFFTSFKIILFCTSFLFSACSNAGSSESDKNIKTKNESEFKKKDDTGTDDNKDPEEDKISLGKDEDFKYSDSAKDSNEKKEDIDKKEFLEEKDQESKNQDEYDTSIDNKKYTKKEYKKYFNKKEKRENDTDNEKDLEKKDKKSKNKDNEDNEDNEDNNSFVEDAKELYKESSRILSASLKRLKNFFKKK